MPKNMMKLWKTGGRKGSDLPVMPIPSSSKSAFDAMMQPVPATRPTMNTTADCASQLSFEPPMAWSLAVGGGCGEL